MQNYSALYGIAYCYREIERKKSKTLFHQYLEMAPNCDKQFPNACYMLAKFVAEANIDEALRYCALAEKSKMNDFHFFNQFEYHRKKMMQTLKVN
jgi:hypothetical protein